ncbi:MAG TPA: 50S ribosomal protein L25, partial [Myxococcales bacterium]|nr:50S ribosomal protein L25 [Myxococcales bacterium]
SLLTLCRDLQIHPVTRQIRHVDFYSIDPKQVIQLKVPIRLTGRSAGQKIGGKLLFVRRWVNLECTAETLPDAITMALEPFEIGDMIGVDDLPFPEGVRPIYRKAFKVFEIKAARTVEEVDEDEVVAAAPAADAAEEA